MMKTLVLSSALMLSAALALAENAADDGAGGAENGVAPAMTEADLASAQKIFNKSCRACHGNKGQGASSYPRLSDKEPDYIADKLARYRAGEKFGPNSILMIQHARKLSDADIVNLSVYVATAFD
jgi:cytochrome c553